MKRARLFSSLLALLFVCAAVEAKHAQVAQPQRYLDDVKYLAAPERQGRGAGTAGLEQAADYIADQFRKLKLQPAGDDGTFFQKFRVTTSAHPGTQNSLSINGSRTLQLQSDFTPLSFSSNGTVEGDVIFAGYGITAPEHHYDDYAGVDAKGKIVLVLRYEPPSFPSKGSGDERAYTHHAHLVSKAINARDHGAKAVLLVNGTLAKEDKLIPFGTVAGPENSGVLMVQIKNSAANELVSAAGMNLTELQKRINSSQQPASALLPHTHLNLRVDIQLEHAYVKNVVAFMPGATKEYIIIGAHYDHLGSGNENSLAPSQIGRVHPGADDNASGTAGVLELARVLSSQGKQPKRGVLFMNFAGEEIGLLGSAYWVNHPTMPLADAAAMINLDMIGRVNGSRLYIGGTGTGSTFNPMLKTILPEYDFKVDYSQDGYSASDHTSFASKGIPVLFFFSGLHGDYHKPSDTWDKISPKNSAEVVDLVSEIATNLANADTRPKYEKVQPNPHAGGQVPAGSGYGPYFGSIPDFAPVEKGVKFSDVRPGSPAAKAGLRAGDILIGYGDKPINNLYDFTFALRSSKVGDVVKVTVLRDGKEVTSSVTLEPRQ